MAYQMKKIYLFLPIVMLLFSGCVKTAPSSAQTSTKIDAIKATESPLVSPSPKETITPKETIAPTQKANSPVVALKKTEKPAISTQAPKVPNNDAIQTPKPTQQAPQTPIPTQTPIEKNTIELSIIGIDDQRNILTKEEVEINDGESVMDILIKVTKSKKIQMEFSGRKSAAYIKGIDNLYEFDKGEASGWMYSVNGEFPSKSAGEFKLKKGDIVTWNYTLDLGKDLGARGF